MQSRCKTIHYRQEYESAEKLHWKISGKKVWGCEVPASYHEKSPRRQIAKKRYFLLITLHGIATL